MVLPVEITAAMLATFTASRLCGIYEFADKWTNSIWIALAYGGSEGTKGMYVQPRLTLVPFGKQTLFRTAEGSDALRKVAGCLFICLFNIFAFILLQICLSRQTNPIPFAFICLLCAARLWILQLRLLRLNLVYRHDAFQRLLPFVLIMAAAFAAVLCLDELPLHKHLGFAFLKERIEVYRQQWATELAPLNFGGVSQHCVTLLLICCSCLWLLLFAAAAAATIEELEVQKEAIRKRDQHFHPLTWRFIEGCSTTLEYESAASVLATAALLLLLPPIFSLGETLVDGDFLWWLRAALAATALLLRIASARNIVQASVLRQSYDLAKLLEPDAPPIRTEQQRELLLKATKCVSLVNRSTAVRLAEVLLLPSFLLLLLCAYTVMHAAPELSPSPPPHLISALGTDKAAASHQAAAISRAAAVCSFPPQRGCEGCCHKSSMLQEVYCPLVYNHFESLREKTGHGKAAEGNAAAAAWRPLLFLFLGDKQQRHEALQLFSSLSMMDTIRWFRYSFMNPPLVSTDFLLFLQSFLFLQLLAVSFQMALLEAFAALRVRRLGASEFSVWGPEVPAKGIGLPSRPKGDSRGATSQRRGS